MTTQSLNSIVNVTVSVSPSLPAPSSLNVGLIVGTSTIIPTTTRVQTYSSTADMLSGGWTGTEPEYKAAEAYFSQNPTPSAVVIGRQDATVPETALEAVQACRTASNVWYGVYVCGAADSDIEAIAQYVQSAQPQTMFFYDTQSANVASGTTPNVMSTLQSDKDNRTFGLYSATEQYSGAAAMGLAMGSNTGLANSAFTMAYKSLVGITPDNLTTQQVANITGSNGNVYTTYGNGYELLVQGRMADGTPLDQVLYLDALTVDIQTTVMDALVSLPKIPLTDAGVTMLMNDIAQVCDQAVTTGFLAPGIWNGPAILGLTPGTNLSKGYMILAEKVSTLTQEQIQQRQAPPIYACVKLAGAIEHVVIGVQVSL
ncbi:hypothetical protein Alches_22170 [Alicyclobacillus hesperidum subsp. aegles]|uniref:DUF3383 family protein n=1 Tax=Alicyclobacillus hesperidum TaxID=89784 RepID=UPI00222B801C|nr:DUF3383 family protein [Alicyclobacillus hesperidum]GLG02176.1 hypothetical protein Alches_22170 [Alicyclobacillus hesperidum subsp. aegles]